MKKKARICFVIAILFFMIVTFVFPPLETYADNVDVDGEELGISSHPYNITREQADQIAKDYFFGSTAATFKRKDEMYWDVYVKERPDRTYTLGYYGVMRGNDRYNGDEIKYYYERFYWYQQIASYNDGRTFRYNLLVDTKTGEMVRLGDFDPFGICEYVKDISLSSSTIISGITDKWYTGKEVLQNITVKHDGITLVENRDYIVTYKNNVNIGQATIIITGEGEYGGRVDKTFTIKATIPNGLKRIYGKNRFETAKAIANEVRDLNNNKKFDAIIVSTGLNYPDALAGAYLAKVKNAPIVLTMDGKENDTFDYIKRNIMPNGIVYILGGTGVVSSSFTKGLLSEEILFKRLGGENRYETNLKILNAAGKLGEELIVVTGVNFPDALSASAAGLPIMLVGRSLTTSQKSFIQQKGFSKFTIIGGPTIVDASIYKELKKMGSVSRVYGKNRYETSIKVARKYFPKSKAAVFAIGINYPDALTGGPLAIKLNAPMILTSSRSGDYLFAKDYVKQSAAKKGIVLGGEALITNEAIIAIMK